MRKRFNNLSGVGILSIVFFFAGSCIISCDKKDDNNPDSIVFSDLFAENDTVFIGDTTMVTAVATGEELAYIWSASKGDIDGYGNKVKYLAPPCQPGDFTISCIVKDKSDNEKTKSITINVKLP